MDFSALIGKISGLLNSRLIVFLFCIFIAALNVYKMAAKSKRLKNIIADERFNESSFLLKSLRSPIVISSDGYLGIIIEKNDNPLIIHLNDISSFRIISGEYVIVRGGEKKEGELLFNDSVSTLEESLPQKTKWIVLNFTDKNDSQYYIPLFATNAAASGKKPNPTVQLEIKQLLNMLKEVENNITPKKENKAAEEKPAGDRDNTSPDLP